jgi:hypothetical protein
MTISYQDENGNWVEMEGHGLDYEEWKETADPLPPDILDAEPITATLATMFVSPYFFYLIHSYPFQTRWHSIN